MAFPQGTPPQGISYQAVAYDSEGFEISNQDISVRLGILLGGVDVEASYSEVHSVTTDDFGLFSLVISQGETSDTFSSINWEEGAYLKVEVDEDLDGEFSVMGVSSFNAVPYALYAESSNFDYNSIGMITNEDLCLDAKVVLDIPQDFTNNISEIVIDDSLNTYVLSNYNSEPILRKFDQNSSLIWSLSIPISVNNIELHNNNSIIISGYNWNSSSITIDGVEVSGDGYFINIDVVTGYFNWVYAQNIGCTSWADHQFVIDDNYLYFILNTCSSGDDARKINKLDLDSGILLGSSSAIWSNIQKIGIYDNKIICTCYCYSWPTNYNRAFVYDSNTLQQIGDEIGLGGSINRFILSDSTAAYLFIGDNSFTGSNIFKFDGTSVVSVGTIPYDIQIGSSSSSSNIEIMSIYDINQATFNGSVNVTGYGEGSAFIGAYHWDPIDVTNPYNLTALSTLSNHKFSSSQNGNRVVGFNTSKSICINNVTYPGDQFYIIIL